ncbi:MAG: hypothetical protein H6765_03520 [Candidatus Peribacteria bacterium]|nr:MAG: hypothetical protein H6765_03520 [Candidatus Peribacteria bacterium]
MVKKDLHSLDYTLPLVIVGLIFSVYKYWLEKFSDGDVLGLCTSQVSCSDISVEYFGFMTMAFFGIVAFIIMAAIILRINKHRLQK